MLVAFGTLALLYIGLCVFARVVYRHVLYPAPAVDRRPDPIGSTALTAMAADGVAVHALAFFPPDPDPVPTSEPPANGRTIVHFHGNGEVIGDDETFAQEMTARGFAVVLVEYRGYGRSKDSGPPTEAGLYADAEAILALLKTRGVAEKDLILWGQSLGTGVAAEMAARGHGSRLVLVTPYTSIPDIGVRLAPWLPVRLIVTDRFDTRSKVPELTLPTYVLHGTADHVVPYDMGQTLARALPNCTFVTIAGGDHNDLFVADRAGILDAMAEFARGAGKR